MHHDRQRFVVQSVSISYEGKPISKNVTVYGLENVRIQLTDALTKPSLSRMTLR
ncbi:Ig-like domain-containing protein, partial [Escherichia coli]|uniref:Ig-like domain-containing protein n=1 Tax=Escherichia coli TaxID=562 RepID=UPI002078C10D